MFAEKKHLLIGTLLLFCAAGIAVYYLTGDAGKPAGKAEIHWLYPPQYHKGNEFSEGRAWVQERENGPWSLLDDKGNILRSGFEASFIHRYQDGIASFLPPHLPEKRVWSWEPGFLDRSGDVVLSPGVYDDIEGNYGGGLIGRKGKNGLYGFIDISGAWRIPPLYDFQLFSVSEGLVPLRKSGKYGFVDTKGAVVINFEFENAYPFSHKMAAVRVGSKWGVIDPAGQWIAEPTYENFYGPCWSDPIGLEKDGKVGFINSKGEVVIGFKYPPETDKTKFNVYCFNNGRASVILNDSDEENIEYGIIDESGKVLFRRTNCVLILRGDHILCLDEDGQHSIIGRDGREYKLPDDLKFPPAAIGPNENGIFRFTDIEKREVGYFTVSIQND